ncbi:hypothetical protein GCM10010416_74810 [Streptomyces caniferus]
MPVTTTATDGIADPPAPVRAQGARTGTDAAGREAGGVRGDLYDTGRERLGLPPLSVDADSSALHRPDLTGSPFPGYAPSGRHGDR